MSSLNKCMIIGRLGAEPEMRSTQSGTNVTTLSVATSERFKDKNGTQQERTEWHKVTTWGKLAEICNQYLKKGSLAYFEGPIETQEWEDKDGNKRYTTQIKALSMQMLDSKGEGQAQGQAPDQKPSTDLSDLDDESDGLPF